MPSMKRFAVTRCGDIVHARVMLDEVVSNPASSPRLDVVTMNRNHPSPCLSDAVAMKSCVQRALFLHAVCFTTTGSTDHVGGRWGR